MKIAVCSDIHANFLALKCVLEDMKRQEVSQCWFLGDLLGYGPRPLEALELARDAMLLENQLWTFGNHDRLLLRTHSNDWRAYANPVAIQTLGMHESELGKRLDLKEWYLQAGGKIHFQRETTFDTDGVSCILCHDNLHPTAIDEYIWSWQPDSVNRLVRQPLIERGVLASQKPGKERSILLLVGHSHIQYLAYLDAQSHQVQEAEYGQVVPFGPQVTLVNPGSIGLPRDLDPRPAYALVDLARRTVTLRRVPGYDPDKVAQDMIDNDYPNEYVEQICMAPMAREDYSAEYRNFVAYLRRRAGLAGQNGGR